MDKLLFPSFSSVLFSILQIEFFFPFKFLGNRKVIETTLITYVSITRSSFKYIFFFSENAIEAIYLFESLYRRIPGFTF